MPRSGPLPAALSLLLVTTAILPGPAAAQNGESGGGETGVARCYGGGTPWAPRPSPQPGWGGGVVPDPGFGGEPPPPPCFRIPQGKKGGGGR